MKQANGQTVLAVLEGILEMQRTIRRGLDPCVFRQDLCFSVFTIRNSRRDNATDICPDCGMMEVLASIPRRREGPAERTRRAVYATGNKWAIENFNATHG